METARRRDATGARETRRAACNTREYFAARARATLFYARGGLYFFFVSVFSRGTSRVTKALNVARSLAAAVLKKITPRSSRDVHRVAFPPGGFGRVDLTSPAAESQPSVLSTLSIACASLSITLSTRPYAIAACAFM